MLMVIIRLIVIILFGMFHLVVGSQFETIAENRGQSRSQAQTVAGVDKKVVKRGPVDKLVFIRGPVALVDHDPADVTLGQNRKIFFGEKGGGKLATLHILEGGLVEIGMVAEITE